MPMETNMHDEYLEGFYKIQDKYNFELVFSNSNNDSEQYVQNIEIMDDKEGRIDLNELHTRYV